MPFNQDYFLHSEQRKKKGAVKLLSLGRRENRLIFGRTAQIVCGVSDMLILME